MVLSHVPRKRFGQNFLQDQSIIAEIVRSITPHTDDAMVEIGPGLGALTVPLLNKLKQLHAVEIDRDIVLQLRKKFTEDKLVLHSADALKFDFGGLAASVIGRRGRIRLVGNLPYNISTPLLFHLAAFASQIEDCHFMLQNEVVLRMVAAPGQADYGRLSVMLQYHFYMEKLLDVPPHAFYPPPKVNSAVVRLIPHTLPVVAYSLTALEKLVALAFAHRRKTLRNNLKGCADEAAFLALGIAPNARAEELGVVDYVRLCNYLNETLAR